MLATRNCCSDRHTTTLQSWQRTAALFLQFSLLGELEAHEPVDLMRISVDGADEPPARGCVVNSRVTTFLSAVLFSFVLLIKVYSFVLSLQRKSSRV